MPFLRILIQTRYMFRQIILL